MPIPHTHGYKRQTPLQLQLLAWGISLLLLALALLLFSTVRQKLPIVSGNSPPTVGVKLGIDNIDNHLEIFRGKRVGLITNATGLNSRYESSVDVIGKRLNLTALYAPEHGIRGSVVAGATVGSQVDAKTGVPVHSLYGTTKKPTAEMLKNIDILAFDIQDIGARPYTYIYTMAYAMESARENNKLFVVFDRPNPVGGDVVEGGILSPSLKSFVGLYPLPMRHGMTVGELARLFNEHFKINCRLEVVPMTGWRRDMRFQDTGLPWVMTSPNIPTPDSAMAYLATGFYGGTNISEGVGTTRPFELVGAPWLDAEKLAERMNSLKMPGVYFRPVYFTPQWGKHIGRLCGGVQLQVLDRKIFRPVQAGISLLYAIKEMSGTQFRFNPAPAGGGIPSIDLELGAPAVREGKISLADLLAQWEKESRQFAELSKKYWLY